MDTVDEMSLENHNVKCVECVKGRLRETVDRGVAMRKLGQKAYQTFWGARRHAQLITFALNVISLVMWLRPRVKNGRCVQPRNLEC